ncbi:MAG TPA: DUF29 domain-containing protein [Gemmataceae bacterium]|nr:DUF29 domain-containing protein [Gemmataceae bacterium]
MMEQAETALHELYHVDETAWLDAMAERIGAGAYSELDYVSLREFLKDMSSRDRREVFSRLIVLLTHLLKWEHQPDRRSGSWRGTIREQRRELQQLLTSGSLRNHAAQVFGDAYAEARSQAADETELDVSVFPIENPWDLEAALAEDPGDSAA